MKKSEGDDNSRRSRSSYNNNTTRFWNDDNDREPTTEKTTSFPGKTLWKGHSMRWMLRPMHVPDSRTNTSRQAVLTVADSEWEQVAVKCVQRAKKSSQHLIRMH